MDLPRREEPTALSVTSSYDFFGAHAVYVEGFAKDTYCSNSMRALIDRVAIRYVGNIMDFRV